jgi:hypothetical protein
MYQMVLNLESHYVTVAPLRLLRVAALYARFSRHCGVGLHAQFKTLRGFLPCLLWLLGLPLGQVLYWRDQARK